MCGIFSYLHKIDIIKVGGLQLRQNILNEISKIQHRGPDNTIIKNINEQFRLVHRLDKETSGLLLIAKNLNYAKRLSFLFKEKQITKFYVALCEGNPKNNVSEVKLKIKKYNPNTRKHEFFVKKKLPPHSK